MSAEQRIEETQLVVIGGGPGGYVAAFKAADLGIQTTLVDANPLLGGVCLRQGCIPSKALLHVAHLVHDAGAAAEFGVRFAPPEIDVDRVRAWKQDIIEKLCTGIGKIAKSRKINVVNSLATFDDAHTLRFDGCELDLLKFEHAIIATGSSPARLPESIMPPDCYTDSTGALALQDVPKILAVVGGGYIGLELGQVYASLGSQVTVIEMLPQLLPGADADLVRPLAAQLKKEFAAIHTNTKVQRAHRISTDIELTLLKGEQEEKLTFDRVLVSVGRVPNSRHIGLENTNVKIDPRGFIEVDAQRRTAERNIFAIGDVAGEPMLAHKASREGIVAAEAIAGHDVHFAPKAIPAIVYTSPEVAWCGLTENQAAAQGRAVAIGKVQWGAFGRALAMGKPSGTTKIIADPDTRNVLGVGVVGEHAGDLIAEAALAIEMGADADRLAETIHAHPTLSETIMEAAESVFGRAIHSTR